MILHLTLEERQRLGQVVDELYRAIACSGHMHAGGVDAADLNRKSQETYSHVSKAMSRMLVLSMKIEERLHTPPLAAVPDRDTLRPIGADVIQIARELGMQVYTVDEQGVHDEQGTVHRFEPPADPEAS